MRLGRGPAAVRSEYCAGDVRGVVRCEKGDGWRNLLRLGEPTSRCGREQLSRDLRVFEETPREVRPDVAWSYGIDADAAGGPLDRKHSRELDQGALRRAVGRKAGKRHESADRRHVDDRSTLALEHTATGR